MKIYFSGAIAQKDTHGQYYEKIVDALKKWKHKVFQDTTLVSFDEAVNKSDQQRVKYYKQVLKWISDADALVLEVSFPSTLHIGHEVSLALEKGKPVVALYYQDQEPSFFLGLSHSKIFWSDYNEDNLLDTLQEGLNYAQSQTETRFNFYMSSRHFNHLDKMSKLSNMPRATYVRKLIDEDMKRAQKK